MPNMMHYITSYLTMSQAAKKKSKPSIKAMTVIMITNLSSSILRGDFGVALELAMLAIYPKTVESPILTTTPFPAPSFTRVPKKAKFFVSNGSFG